MNFTCTTCGDTVGGRAEHCTVCHRTFTGTTAGDLHRTGQHGVKDGPDRRRCRTDEELAEHGIVRKSNGRWGTELGDAKWWDSEPDSTTASLDAWDALTGEQRQNAIVAYLEADR